MNDGIGRGAGSRRRFAKTLLAGGLVVGFNTLTGSWLTAAQAAADVGDTALPRLDGTLHVDEATRAAYADDFGHIVHERPRAVLRPGSVQDIVRMVRFAQQHGLRVVARGQGHTTFGQAQATAAIVVDLGPLQAIDAVAGDRISVGSGARWSAVLAATLARGLTPPVLTDYLGLSVGGTLSVGGVGVTSWRHGAQVDHVQEVEVVTGEGEVLTCSATRNADLFAAVLAGQGQCGIVVRVTFRLVRAPSHVRAFTLVYPDLTALTADCRLLIRDGRFDTVQGFIVPAEGGGWSFLLEATAFFTDAPPDDDRLLAGLRFIPGTVQADTRTYVAWAHRLDAQIAFLQSQGLWTRPHPWIDLFVPGREVDRLVGDTLAHLRPEDLGPFAPILLFPLDQRRFTRPLFRTAPSEVVFLFDMLRTAPDDPAAVQRLVAANRALFERTRALGGTLYPISAVPLSRLDWRQHYGPQWDTLVSAKRRYDPHGVLASGPDIFP